ncbi:hypothetical protein NIA73_06510 [Anaerobutyricum hallii]|nr:hypothetical protein [Anaerobutyricum hallii]
MSRQFDENIEAIDPLETMPPAKKKYGHFFSGRYFQKVWKVQSLNH